MKLTKHETYALNSYLVVLRVENPRMSKKEFTSRKQESIRILLANRSKKTRSKKKSIRPI